MTRCLRHLLVFDASLADDPYICWLYAAQFAATANAPTGSAGFLPLFPYRGPQPGRLSMEFLRCVDPRPGRRRKTVRQRLHLSEDPAVTITSLDAGKRRFLSVVNDLHAGLESVILFGKGPVDVVELAKLVHVGCGAIVPGIVCVVQHPRAPDIVAAGLRGLGIPLYLDVGYDQSRDGSLLPDDETRHGAGRAECGVHGVFSFWSESEYPFTPRRSSAADWSSILPTVSRRPRAAVVLFLRPDWPHCGSFTTFKNIAMRYAERGTVIVDVALDENKRRYSKQETSDRLWDSRHDLSPALMYSGARSRTLHSKWAAKVGRRKGLVAEHVHRYAGAAAPRWLRRFLRASRPDYAYVNHYFTMDYLRKLMLDLPIMLDIHDIQSVNYLHHKYSSKSTGRSETFSDLLEEELNFFRRANAIAFVSADELDLVAPRLPEIDIFHFIAVPKVVPTAPEPDRNDGPRRVLIVASRNPGNEANLTWFLDSVWPGLRDTGAVLDIVGTISSHLDGKAIPEGCTLHGAVPALGVYYANSNVVALPIVTGGGVAIKTIEALLHERPVCATSHAFRGLGHSLRSQFPRIDDAGAFAADLRSLIEDPAAARERLAMCREAAKALARERFDEAFEQRHRAMLACKGRAQALSQTLRPGIPVDQCVQGGEVAGVREDAVVEGRVGRRDAGGRRGGG